MTRMLPAGAVPDVSGSSRLSASLFFPASAPLPPPITRPAPAMKCEAQAPMGLAMHREARSCCVRVRLRDRRLSAGDADTRNILN